MPPSCLLDLRSTTVVVAFLLFMPAPRSAAADCSGLLFGLPVHLDAFTTPHASVIADFNEDGHGDFAIAVSNMSAGTGDGARVALFLGSGNGQFTHANDFMTDPGCFGLVTADFDQDGILDLATSNIRGNSVSILLGQGSGGIGNGAFAPAVHYSTGPGSSWSLATGDFDEDGTLDLVTSNNINSNLTLLRGLGDGTFVFSRNIGLASHPTDIQVADLNEDGISDLVVAIPNSRAIWVLRGLGTNGIGNGAFAAPISWAAGNEPFMFDLADFDSDGILDLAVANSGFGGLRLMRGQGSEGVGNGGFTDAQIVVPGNFGDVRAVDIDQDGLLDIVSTRTHSTEETPLVVSIGHGDLTFDTPQLISIGRVPLGLAVGNLDASPALDVVVCNYLQNRVSVLTGTCSGPTAIVVSAFEPVLLGDGVVRLEWCLDEPASVDVQRSSGALWETRASLRSSASGAVLWTDSEVIPGETYEYRLRLPDGSLAGTVAIRIPALALAVDRVAPQPVHGDRFEIRFHLPDREPATLDILDVRGRRVLSQAVDSFGPGSHVFRVRPTKRVPAGVYMVRLMSGSRKAVTRVVVIQ